MLVFEVRQRFQGTVPLRGNLVPGTFLLRRNRSAIEPGCCILHVDLADVSGKRDEVAALPRGEAEEHPFGRSDDDRPIATGSAHGARASKRCWIA